MVMVWYGVYGPEMTREGSEGMGIMEYIAPGYYLTVDGESDGNEGE